MKTVLSISKNSDFFWQAFAPAKPVYLPSMVIAGFCSCKASIHAIHGNKRIFRGAEL